MKLIIPLIALLFSGCSIDRNDCDRDCLAGIYLTEIGYDLLLLSDLDSLDNQHVRSKINSSITRKISMIIVISPNIDKLGGSELEILCFLTEMIEDLKDGVDGDLFDFSKTYLSLIEPDVKNEIHRIQSALRGTGCVLSPGSPFRVLSREQ